MAERMALNAPIQGSAADLIKRAMLAVDDRLAAEGMQSRQILQVHDELVIEAAPGEADARGDHSSGGNGRARASSLVTTWMSMSDVGPIGGLRATDTG